MDEILSELGFKESYYLWDDACEYKEGTAYVNNGLTLCIRGDRISLFNRWTGKFCFRDKIKEDTFEELKKHLNA